MSKKKTPNRNHIDTTLLAQNDVLTFSNHNFSNSAGLLFLNRYTAEDFVVLFLGAVSIKFNAQTKQFYYVILTVKEFCKI